MRYVIIRDDDTNAFTPWECLERLYRPFLDKGLPVNLAVIPEVATNVKLPDGRPEGFLPSRNGSGRESVPIGENSELLDYFRDNRGYKVVQHGLHHRYWEFEEHDHATVRKMLWRGTSRFLEAGLPKPATFVAPYDRFSRSSFTEVANQFQVISTGWFELRRLPFVWWPWYVRRKLRRHAHWSVPRTILLSHPGCLLSCFRPYSTMLENIVNQVQSRKLTVLVTHWWEYFRSETPDTAFIGFLHQTADYLAANEEIQVISFEDLTRGSIQLD